jgi:hypothetical protein
MNDHLQLTDMHIEEHAGGELTMKRVVMLGLCSCPHRKKRLRYRFRPRQQLSIEPKLPAGHLQRYWNIFATNQNSF